MELLLWIVLGLGAGFAASFIVNSDGALGIVADVVLGVVGAFMGGFVMTILGFSLGFNLPGIIVTAVGAGALIWAGRIFRYS